MSVPRSVQAKRPKSSSSGCSGALGRARPQLSWRCSWAPTLSAKGGGDGYPERLQGCTRTLGTQAEEEQAGPHVAGKILDESELQKVLRRR